ncbi:MAG TPA: hypothetical protein VK388_04245, partial [Pyrinomonadaceae bacterium]|nr:hypothetical protein [Pyrinomonadaceae bacterium]
MSSYTFTVAVSTVYPGPFGGSVFSGKDSSGRLIRAVADSSRMLRIPLRGEVWELTGTFVQHPQYGEQLLIEQSKLLPPKGHLLIQYLINHPSFRGIGIGQAKVARLYQQFDEQLSVILDEGRVEPLSDVLGEETAQKLIA